MRASPWARTTSRDVSLRYPGRWQRLPLCASLRVTAGQRRGAAAGSPAPALSAALPPLRPSDGAHLVHHFSGVSAAMTRRSMACSVCRHCCSRTWSDSPRRITEQFLEVSSCPFFVSSILRPHVVFALGPLPMELVMPLQAGRAQARGADWKSAAGWQPVSRMPVRPLSRSLETAARDHGVNVAPLRQ